MTIASPFAPERFDVLARQLTASQRGGAGRNARARPR